MKRLVTPGLLVVLLVSATALSVAMVQRIGGWGGPPGGAANIAISSPSTESSGAARATGPDGEWTCENLLVEHAYDEDVPLPSELIGQYFTGEAQNYRWEGWIPPQQVVRVWWCWDGTSVKDGAITLHRVDPNSLEQGRTADRIERIESVITQVGDRYVVRAVSSVGACINYSAAFQQRFSGGVPIEGGLAERDTSSVSQELCAEHEGTVAIELCGSGNHTVRRFRWDDDPATAPGTLRSDLLTTPVGLDGEACSSDSVAVIDREDWICANVTTQQLIRRVEQIDAGPAAQREIALAGEAPGTMNLGATEIDVDAFHEVQVWWCFNGTEVRDATIGHHSTHLEGQGLATLSAEEPALQLVGNRYLVTASAQLDSCSQVRELARVQGDVGNVTLAGDLRSTLQNEFEHCAVSSGTIELELCASGEVSIVHHSWPATGRPVLAVGLTPESEVELHPAVDGCRPLPFDEVRYRFQTAAGSGPTDDDDGSR